MKLSMNKNSILSILLAVVAVAIIWRITPVYVDPVVKLVISKNRAHIGTIHQPRDIEISKEVMVDNLNLHEKSRFRHPKLGEIGYGDQFFVDVNHEFTVKKPGRYRFNIASDDGFSAAIDGKLLCEFQQDRPFTMESCPVNLTAGKHQFKLSYFQGYGQSGLTVEYMNTDDNKSYFFGKDSKHIAF
jgi:hypothetical protein